MKIILILLDGIGDRSYKILNNRTPLQEAHTPNLDRLARLGSNGLFHASHMGQCLPSEMAHYLLFGYDQENFPGRGLLEAVGEGVFFNDGDILSLAHLSSVIWNGGVPVLTHGRKAIKGDSEKIEQLFRAVTPYETQGVRFKLCRTGPNDAILVISGDVSPHVSDSDPMTIGRPMAKVKTVSGNPEPEKAAKTADALNNYLSYCHSILSGHEVNRRRTEANLPSANFLATQRCGRRTPQESFYDLWGLRGMVIASGSVYMGLAHELGLKPFRVKDSNDPGKDLKERVRIAVTDTSHDFIHVHTKAPDEAGHTKDPLRKKEVIELLDRGLGEFTKQVEEGNDLLALITADHSTPSSSTLIHSGEPVPVTLVGPNVRRDEVTAFDEISAAWGCLGLLRGQELMLMALNYSDRSVLHGHRLGKKEALHFPDTYEPFKLTD